MDNFEAEFPILRDQVFLNHSAVSPLPSRTAGALRLWVDQAATGVARDWGLWAAALRRTRTHGAALMGCARDEVAFIHNTTHGLLIVANSLEWRPGDNVVVAAHEFPANLHPWLNLRTRGVATRLVPEQPDRRLRLEDYLERIDSRTRLVSVSMVQYSTGFRAPIARLAQACRERGALLCVDGIQGLGGLPVNVKELGCHFFAADGHKWLLAPEGLGILYIDRDVLPLMNDSMTGWVGRENPSDYDNVEQPLVAAAKRFEEGAHSMILAAALEKSLELLLEVGQPEIWRRIEALGDRLVEGLRSRGLKVISPRGGDEKSGIVAFEPGAGVNPDNWFKALRERNIHIASRRGFIRVAPHFYNKPEQIDQLLAAVDEIRNS